MSESTKTIFMGIVTVCLLVAVYSIGYLNGFHSKVAGHTQVVFAKVEAGLDSVREAKEDFRQAKDSVVDFKNNFWENAKKVLPRWKVGKNGEAIMLPPVGDVGEHDVLADPGTVTGNE